MTTENTELAKTEVSAMGKFRNLLNQDTIKTKFNEALGKKAPLFMSNLVTIMSGSVELQKCEPMSVISSALMAASMDLSITPGLGFAGIVPYWDTPSGTMRAQFQVMKKGYIQLAQRTGLFKIINVSEVFEGELESYNKFTGEYVFKESGRKSDKIIGYVSYFRLINGFEKYLYMPIEKLDAHARKYSKSFQRGKGKWADKEQGGYEQMCEKTVLKLNLSTYAPLSVDINMMNAIVYDQAEIRDLEAKDFDYFDNEESRKHEEKEVLSIGEDKTIVIEKSAEKKSERITQSVVDKVNVHKFPPSMEATRGSVSTFNGVTTFTDNAVSGDESQGKEEEQVDVPERDPRLKEGQFTKEEMEKMDTKVLLEMINQETDLIEAMDIVPGKNTNKKLRELIFAWQVGELAVYVAPHMVNENGENEDVPGGEESPVAGEDPLSKVNKNFDQQQGASNDLFMSGEPEQGEMERGNEYDIPGFDKGQERSFGVKKNLFNLLAKEGIDNNRYVQIAMKMDILTKFPDREALCQYADSSTINELLNSN